VTVAEGKHQRFNGGVGYGTEEKGRVDAEYHHVNFLGGARSAGVHGRYSSLDRGIRFDFNQPYFFGARNALGLDGQRWHSETPAYLSDVTGGKVTMTRRPSGRTSMALSLLSERTDSLVYDHILADPSNVDELIALGLDPTTGRQAGTLSAVGVDFQHTTADNMLNASRGYQIALHAEEAGRLLPGTFNYFGVAADLRHYLPLGPSVVVANRVQFGNIAAANNDPAEVPFSKKYFLGGATSLRGWGRYEVSPLLSGTGTPIGGNTLIAFSTEVRAKIWGSFGGVLFADAGNVWATDSTTDEEQESVSLADLRYDVGAGVRYHTPIGPIRLDFGYQLNPIDGLLIDGQEQLRQWRLHFSIGQAF